MNKYLIVILCLVVLTGCVGSKVYTREELKQQNRELLANIELNDGVNYEEAKILSDRYFGSYVSGCGMPGEILDKGEHWEAEMVIGIAAKKMDDKLKIDKRTGRMTLKNFPTIENPLKELNNPSAL